MGIIHVTAAVRKDVDAKKQYEKDFLVDTGSVESMAPAKELNRIGIKPIGKQEYELANGQRVEYDYGVCIIEFMGQLVGAQIIFGENHAEPILGVTALENAGIIIDPRTQKLKRLSAIPLK